MKPKVRALEAIPLDGGFYLRDPMGISEGLWVSEHALYLISLMDGTRSLLDIKADFLRATGYLLRDEEIKELLESLEENFLLEGPRFRERLNALKQELISKGVREPSHVGIVYPSEPEELRSFLKLEEKEETFPMLGIMAPHMDLRVAKRTYWEGYGRLRGEKKLVLILGVSHYWHEMPFSVLPVDIATPFGTLKTRKDLINKLQELYTFDITHDLLAYRQEHSIEFASLYVGMLYPRAEVLAMIVSYGELEFLKSLAENLLRLVEKELDQTLVVSGIDLSHVGQKFGDVRSYDPSFRDIEYLELIKDLKVEEAFELLQKDKNRTRIDGQYTNVVFTHFLRQAGAKEGRLFDYDKHYERETDSVVSYASVGFM